MKFLWHVFLCGWILCGIAAFTATAEKAEWLIRYEKKSKRFELNEDALSKLSRLEEPIKVVSAIGDARIGKSTTLNVVLHKWKVRNGNIEEVFETGDSALSVTHGIWMSIFQNSKKENIVLLDVEGTNVGNDAITDHLSIFTTLMSSGTGVFCSETVKNNILDFLYRLPRLSEFIFKGTDQTRAAINFGHLHVVIRGALRPPKRMSLKDHVKDLITKPSGDDESTNEKRKLIVKYFRREDITVSEMPFIQDEQSFFTSNFQVRHHVKYWDAIQVLAQQFENCAVKTTLLGGLVDGRVLAKLARTLVETINKDAWMEFGDTYLTVEKTLCDRSYDALIAPVMALETSTEVEGKKSSSLQAFKDRCALPEQVTKAQNGLIQLIKRHQAAEETERKRIEAEKKRKEAEEKQREAEEKKKEAEQRKREAERRREEMERQKLEADRRREEAEQRARALESAKHDGGGDGVDDVAKVAAAVAVVFALFSDSRLKHNIVTLSPSKYQVLGLREVAWVWNEDAQRLGLSGEARGLIAQEVEQLYPWTVLAGHDGYKRVNYAALDLMVALVSNKHIARLANISNGSSSFPPEIKTAVCDVKGKPSLPGDVRSCSVVTQWVN